METSMRDRSNPKGSQPYQAPDPVSAPPVQAVSWPDDESRQTVVQTNLVAWQRHTDKAYAYRADTARLRGELAELNQQFDAIRQQIGDKGEEIARSEHYEGQEQRAADGYALALAVFGAPVPAPVDGVKVAPFGEDPNPTGMQSQPESCPSCGEPMRWTPDRGFVHDLPGGGWASAGEMCKRVTQADPQVGAS